MQNLWEFFFQTTVISLVAGLLLILKTVFADKLSPRWQYGIWTLLALRILIPADARRQILLPVGLWIETVKGYAERQLSSVYSTPYEPVCLTSAFPWIRACPQSVTDWLFAGYLLGIVMILFWHLFRYVHLRLLLKKGVAVGEKEHSRIERIATAYHLKSCPAIAVRGLKSAFVCGVLRPVLVLPADTVASSEHFAAHASGGELPAEDARTDDKVILHELLHLKYHDVFQNLFWFVLRTLHWCNPFLQYVFNRIGNDMESLCDQRVLEHLEGEERREYGRLLLSMVNEKYARTPGTSSLSNGGRQISRRIEAIVRFKKYPRGMALVSVCIGILLIVPCFIGTTYAQKTEEFHPQTDWEWERMLAFARLNRCTTMAGALDTYAKGLLFENPGYFAIAAPAAVREETEQSLRTGDAVFAEKTPMELEIIPYAGYEVYNLEEVGEGKYRAILSFAALPGALAVPVSVRQEDGWVVEECGEWMVMPDVSEGYLTGNRLTINEEIPYMSVTRMDTDHGNVSLQLKTIYRVDNRMSLTTSQDPVQSMLSGMGISSSNDETWKPDAEFEEAWISAEVVYDFRGTKEKPEVYVGIQTYERKRDDPPYEFPALRKGGDSVSGSFGEYDERIVEVAEIEGERMTLGLSAAVYSQVSEPLDDLQMLDVQLWWDGQIVERMAFEGVK